MSEKTNNSGAQKCWTFTAHGTCVCTDETDTRVMHAAFHNRKVCGCAECQEFGNAPSGTGFLAQRPLDFPERRTGVRGGIPYTTRRYSGKYHNPANQPRSAIPPLVGPDCMGLLESALRILIGIQTNWNTELLEMSPDGRHCKLKHPGYIGWILTDALLNLNGEGWLS